MDSPVQNPPPPPASTPTPPQSPHPSRLKFNLIIAAFPLILIPITLLLSFPATLLVKSFGGGIAGLAFGLSIAHLVRQVSIICTVISLGVILRLTGFKSILKVTIYAFLFVFEAFWLLDIISAPSWANLIILELVVIGAFNLMYWWFNTLRLHTIWKYVLPLLFTFISFMGVAYSNSLYEDYKVDQLVHNRNFQVYASSQTTYPDTEYLRYQGSTITIPFVSMNLKTPKGNISIHQAAWDENIRKLLIPPNLCDQRGLWEYTGVWGKKTINTTTTEACQLVSESPDGKRKVLAPIHPNEYSGSAPYIAIIEDTVIVFNGGSASGGEFNGTPEEAAKYVVQFAAEARALTDEELVIK